MEAEWLACDYQWNPRAFSVVIDDETQLLLAPGAAQPESGHSVPGSQAQTASQHTGGSGDGSGGSLPLPPPRGGGGAGAKGGRRNRSGRTPAACQVEGCGVSLEGGKPFYRLQRICEQHARALFVTDASGQALRFCQQCTRLHPLSDFEGAKRSCAVSLLRRMERKHRQQQKRQQEDVEIHGSCTRRTRGASSSRLASAVLAGTSSGSREEYTASDSPCSSGGLNGRGSHHSGGSGASLHARQQQQQHQQQQHQHQQQQDQPQSSMGLLPAGTPSHLLPLLGPEMAAVGGLVGDAAFFEQQLAAAAAALQQQPVQGMQVQQVGGHGLNNYLSSTVPALDSYLSSTVPALNSARPAQQQPAVPSLTSDEIDRLLVMEPDDLAAALLARTDSASTHDSVGALAQLSSSIPALEAALTAHGYMTSGPGLLPLAAGSAGERYVEHHSGLDAAVAATYALGVKQEPQYGSPGAGAGLPLGGGLPSGGAGGFAASVGGLPASSLALGSWPAAQDAAALLQGAGAPLSQAVASAVLDPHAAEAQPLMARFSLKVYGLAPDQLPPHLQRELESALATSPTVMAGAIRSGCTFLTTDVLLSCSEAAALEQPAGSAGVLARLLRAWLAAQRAPQARPWQLPTALSLLRVLAQAETASAGLLLQPLEPTVGGGGEGYGRLAAAGGAVCPIALGGPGSGSCSQEQLARLQLTSLGPVATTVGAARGRFVLRCPDWQQLLLGGAGGGAPRVVHCRSRGRHVAVALLPPGDPAGGEGAEVAAQHEEAEEEGPAHMQRQVSVEREDATQGYSSASEAEAEDVAMEAAAQQEQQREEQEDAALLSLLQQQLGAEAWVSAAERQWGLYEFELAGGPFLGEAAPVLVLPDHLEAAAAEVQQLQLVAAAAALQERQQPPPEGPLPPPVAALQQVGGQRLCRFTARVVRLVSTVLVFLEEQHEVAVAAASGAPGAAALAAAHEAAYPPAARQRLAAAATWLCALCVRLRWPALLRQLLPGTTACGSPAEAVAAMDALLPAGTLGTAAASGRAGLLSALADWGAAAGHTWQLAGFGPRGLTPLHLAAAVGPRLSPEAAAALMSAVGAGVAAECWRSARAGGWTPGQVASAAATSALAALLSSSQRAAGAADVPPAPLGSPRKSMDAVVAAPSGSGAGEGEEQRLRLKQAELDQQALLFGGDAGVRAAREESAALLRRHVELQLGKVSGGAGGPSAPRARLPATAAELEAWRRRPLHPAALVAVGGAAILLVLGLAAALRCGVYA